MLEIKTSKRMMYMKEFREEYLKKLSYGLSSVPAEDFEKVATILLDAWENNKQVFIFGNGGSAATASHFACDLGKGTLDNVYDMHQAKWLRLFQNLLLEHCLIHRSVFLNILL